MICFRDMTFCDSDCINTKCPRHFDEQDKRDAGKWWGGPDAPVAFSEFSKDCKDFQAIEAAAMKGGE